MFIFHFSRGALAPLRNACSFLRGFYYGDWMKLFETLEENFPAQTAAVVNAERNGRLSHAYLVHSDDESARRVFSLFLACVAACPNSQAGRPCGVCEICDQIVNESYPELFMLMPTSKSRRILIGDDVDEIDTMRWFQDKFHLTSVGAGRKKVGIIHEAERAMAQAQNAFLKTLEEPPAASIFILCTDSPQSLLPTIRSRCHILTLLRNQCGYPFSGAAAVASALFNLQTTDGDALLAGEEATSALLEVSMSLKEQAELRVAPKWERKIAEMNKAAEEASTPAERRHWTAMSKKLCERRDAAAAAEYLGLRSLFTSLIHTWFAQVYLLACGADVNSLPARSLYDSIDVSRLLLPEETALRHLRKAEELLGNLRWSVNEELAFREFCLAIAVRKA